MRFSALVPALCCLAALILSFLCLFAGHKQSFMEDYHLVTLNTSQVGQTLLPEDRSSDNPIIDLLNEIPNAISEAINDRIGDVRQRIGVEDFYSAHMLNYCYGQYMPAEVANDTVSHDDISKNVTGCSKSQAMYRFDPTEIIQEALNKSTGVNVTLEDLNWPSDIQKGIDALNALMGAMFVLYIIAIVLIFIALVTSLATVFTAGRLSACLNVLVSVLAFVGIGLASALVTAVVVKAADVINQYGNDIGVEAYFGRKFLGLTWAATGVMVGPIMGWTMEVCMGRREKNKRVRYSKEG
ncbi:actin cortical patch SUR7/pH-response regulator pali [Phaeosphaeria sp. MPI-PUGE-AT-0046c]|nr:actin cortical patch SUR7/pH-response regulator pali [Phaeosphaeria sp. MPI-PUGE-AT-0046c]